MFTYTVSDMTCGHCERAIRNEIQALDPQAEVQVNLEAQSVQVHSSQSLQAIQQAIEAAGYTVTQPG